MVQNHDSRVVIANYVKAEDRERQRKAEATKAYRNENAIMQDSVRRKKDEEDYLDRLRAEEEARKPRMIFQEKKVVEYLRQLSLNILPPESLVCWSRNVPRYKAKKAERKAQEKVRAKERQEVAAEKALAGKGKGKATTTTTTAV